MKRSRKWSEITMERLRRWSEITMKMSGRRNRYRLADLPEEILLNILSRLPINSILTCRCVSKTWLKLLSSSNTHFTKLHFTRSPVQLIFEITSGFFHFVELEDDTDLDNSVKPVRPRFRFPMDTLVVINSCNGFLSLAPFNCNNSPVRVCNPITGEYLNLPKHNTYEYDHMNVVSGFGFCANTNQYKVVRLMHRQGIVNDRVVEVYTIGTNSWRNIGTAPQYPKMSYCTTFFNGKILWVCLDQQSSDFIISFDLESEKFGNVPPPPHFSPETIRESYGIWIGVLGEFLYMSYNMELWVMKEYGSWTKVRVRRQVDSNQARACQAIKYLSGGKILMINGERKLISYDPVKGISKEFKVHQSDWRFCQTISLVPSFMSFNDAMLGDKDGGLRTNMCRVERKRRSTRRN